jgi:hypothetical protein
MTVDDFWAIVDRVHLASGGNMDTKCKLLVEELRKLPADEVQSFDQHFSNCLYLAYTWDLWGTAYIICGGCSDDSFMDFRSTLISMGRTIFERAVADAESLAVQNIDPDSANYEGYQYPAVHVYELKTGREMPRYKQHPRRVKGVAFKAWAMSKRFPKLTVKYGYKDSEGSYDKRQALQRNKKFGYTQNTGEESEQVRRTLANLLMDSGIIPSCGFIPPLRVVASVLQQGRFISMAGKTCSWKPFKVEEGDYWLAVNKLERLTPKDVERRKDIVAAKIQLDIVTPTTDQYSEWLQSLRQRGLA